MSTANLLEMFRDTAGLAEWLDMLVTALKASQKYDYNEWGQFIMGAESWADKLRAPASTVAPQQSKHHKYCSSWTVNTSGERQPCDCVCECTHSMFQHIRPGEHYWYENCAVDGCPCMKFAAPASPAALRDEAELDNYVAWCRYTYDSAGCIRSIVTSDSDAKGAFKVYRAPLATTPPSTLAKAAAEEIHRLCDKLAPDIPNDSTSYAPTVEQIAAIIERCLAGGE